MYFANPWGLLGLLALPVIVGIHLYHRRFPPLTVAGLHLWSIDTRKESPGRTRERLPLTRTLLLELLAALLIALLIADPRDGSTNTRPHLVIVLDDSASMSAVASGDGLSTRDRVVKWTDELESSIGRTALFSVMTTGRRPTLIAGPRADWSEMRAAIDNWQPAQASHSFAASWDLGAQLAGDDAEFVFLTDRLPDEQTMTPLRMETRAFGRTLDNVAITAARWIYSAQTGEGTLFVRIANLGTQSTDVDLNAVAKGQSIIEETQTLPAGVEKSLEWILPGGLGQVTFSATAAGDPLAIDHTLQLIEPTVRRVTIAVTLPSSHPAFEPTRKILGVLPNTQLGDPDQADLIIAPAGDTPAAQRGLWWLGLGPISTEDQARQAARTLIGPYLIEKQNPLMNGIVLGGVVWGGVQQAPDNLLPVVSTGQSMLFGQWANVPTNAYLMNIDLTAANLTESPDWPIFWTNLIEQCSNSQPGFRRWNFQLEEPIRFSLAADRLDIDQDLELVFEKNVKPLLRTQTVEIPPRSATGVYEVRDAETSLGRFAVNFLDRQESELLALESGVRPAQQSAVAVGIHWDNPFSWLLVLGILAVLLAIYADWYVLKRS